MAQIDDRIVRHERFYLVDPLFDLFVRFVGDEVSTTRGSGWVNRH